MVGKQVFLCVAFQFSSLNVSILNESMDVNATKDGTRVRFYNVASSILRLQAKPSSVRRARTGERGPRGGAK